MLYHTLYSCGRHSSSGWLAGRGPKRRHVPALIFVPHGCRHIQFRCCELNRPVQSRKACNVTLTAAKEPSCRNSPCVSGHLSQASEESWSTALEGAPFPFLLLQLLAPARESHISCTTRSSNPCLNPRRETKRTHTLQPHLQHSILCLQGAQAVQAAALPRRTGQIELCKNLLSHAQKWR